MKNLTAFAVGVGLIGSFVVSASAHAAQVLTPKRAGADISTGALPGGVFLPAGTILPIDMVYSIVNTGGQTQTKDESGLGLKVQYDSTKFDPVVVYDVNGVQTSTSISSLNTKCMIASPSDQLVSGNTREVVFGWIDTSIRAGGAVGWLGTADPAAPGAANGCLNPGTPGIVTTSAAFDAVAAPVTLFQMGLKSKTSFNTGSTNVVITTAGNISYANASNVDTNKSILVNAAAAPACNLDVDGNGSVTAFRDGILIIRHMLGLSGTSLVSGLSPVPDATTVTNNVTAIMSLLDINGNLPSAGTTPFVDGILLIRMMLNLNGTALTSGITVSGAALSASNSTRSLPSALINYVNSTCSTSYVPGTP